MFAFVARSLSFCFSAATVVPKYFVFRWLFFFLGWDKRTNDTKQNEHLPNSTERMAQRDGGERVKNVFPNICNERRQMSTWEPNIQASTEMWVSRDNRNFDLIIK